MAFHPDYLDELIQNLLTAERLFAQQEVVVEHSTRLGLKSDLAIWALDVMWDLLCTFRNTAQIHRGSEADLPRLETDQ